jgi:hypothetical protein
MVFDILSSAPVAGDSEVTVNLAVSEVAVTNTAASLFLRNANGDRWFAAGDNIILTGAWINVPYGLGQGTGLALINIAWEDSLGNISFPPELGTNGGGLPFVNFCAQEFPPTGLFIACPRNSGRVFLRITAVAANVSMLNVPAGIDGLVLDVQWHLRVNHTLPLSALP